MNRVFILFFTTIICAVSIAGAVQSDAIRLNQVGFYPDGPKMGIVVEAAAEEFFITTQDLKDTVFTGSLSQPMHWSYSDENVKRADFSELTKTGTFVLNVPGLGQSYPFDIKPRVHQEVARAAAKAYYFQRMSIDLTEEFAGKWHRPMGHPDDHVLVHSSAASEERPEGTVLSFPRGWYDAGDYNKYIVNSGISTYTLLAAYEHFPEYCKKLQTNIPESDNSLPDILDEALWNVRWMLTMQDPNDGGVYHKCTHANFSAFVMPHEATKPRYVVQKSSTAALDFAAVMAQTSRIFREFETERPGFADSCLTAAIAAWNWARNHPDTYYRQNENNQIFKPAITTGEYGDSNDNDEFQWAATELYITTLQDSFLTIIDPLLSNDASVPGWRTVGTLGLYSLALHRSSLTAAIDTSIVRNKLIQLADGLLAEIENSAYRVSLNTFPWGSNAVAANQSMALLHAYELTSETKYLNAALQNLDYILGRNATTYCFVSGQGSKPPMHFHHRPSEADDVVDPIPGLMAGGPNPSQQDRCSGYPSDLPARSYIDDWCSYASNEICINWNSPLVFIAAGIEAFTSPDGLPKTVSIIIESPLDKSIFETGNDIAITATASITSGSVARVEFYANKTKIGVSESAPYTIQWADASPGVYKIYARAIGDGGDFSDSEPIEIVVQSAETVGSILFIVGAPNLNQGDAAIRNRLVQNDYNVTIQDDADSEPFKVDGTDLILVSSTVLSASKIRSEISNIDVPLLSWEMTLFDDFGWTGRKKNRDYGRSMDSVLRIIKEDHPIAQGFSELVPLSNVEAEVTWGWPRENADVIAVLASDTTRTAVFTYETGSKMNKDFTAKARQVGFCFTDDSPATISEEGWQLFFSALNWAKAGERLRVAEKDEIVPRSHQLYQNYPNPFNPETRIQYDLSEPAHVSLEIYNAGGQRVRTLVDRDQSAGVHHIAWNARNENDARLSNGIYFYRLRVGDSFQQVKKMVLLK